MRRWPAILFLKTLILTLTFAFVTSGFAHRIVTPAEAAHLNLALELGIGANDICGGSSEDDATSQQCEACLRALGSDLPPTHVTLAAELLGTTVVIRTAAGDVLRNVLDVRNHPSRAPPVV